MVNNLEIIGREKESDRLINLINEGKSFFALISGEAGIGKTFFTEEILKKSKTRYYLGRSSENAALPYSLLSSILRSYLREEKKSTIDFGPLTKYLSVLLPEIKDGVEIDRETLSQAVCDALTIISKWKPLVIFLDDLQWSDEATLELLPSLSEKLSNTFIMILAAYRSDEIPKGHKIRWMRNELRRRKKLLEFYLFPINIADTQTLIEKFFKAKASPSLVHAIYEKTQGVLFFIQEICDAILTNQIVEIKNNELVLKPDSNIPLPDSITDVVLIKTESLSEESKELLEIAAVTGKVFDLEIFNAIAGSERGLEELFNQNFIKETQTGKAEFKHSLIREAVKNEISWNRRKDINKKLAGYFSSHNYHPEIVAFHWYEANEFENARKAFVESAKRFCNIQAYSDAARSASRALELWTQGIDENERIEILLQLAHCNQLNGQLDEAVKVLKEIVDSTNAENKSLANAYRSLAIIYGLKSKWELVATTRQISAQYFEKGELYEDAAIEYLAGAARFTSLMDLSEALSCSKKAVELGERTKNNIVKSKALGLQGNIIAMLGDPAEGREIVQKGLDLALKNSLIEPASEIYRRLASTMEYQSDYISARNAYSNAYNFCITSGSEVYAQICLGCMSNIFFQTGEWKKSIEICKDVLKNKKSPDGSKSAALCVLGLIYSFRGQTKSAQNFLNQSYNLAKKVHNNIIFFGVLWGSGILADFEEDKEKALAKYMEVLELWGLVQERHDSIPVLMWGANTFSKNNREKELLTCVENLSLISNETSNPEALSALAFSLGEYSVLNKKLTEAAEKFEQSLLHQEKVFVPHEKMFIEFRLGEILIKLKDEARALEYLNSSYSIAKNLGIRTYASKISRLLSEIGYKTGTRIRRDKFEPFELNHLTKRQNEILKLLASGLTNKEIADKLFLSTRTIEMHVAHILERLNCRSRTEAIYRAKELNILV